MCAVLCRHPGPAELAVCRCDFFAFACGQLADACVGGCCGLRWVGGVVVCLGIPCCALVRVYGSLAAGRLCSGSCVLARRRLGACRKLSWFGGVLSGIAVLVACRFGFGVVCCGRMGSSMFVPASADRHCFVPYVAVVVMENYPISSAWEVSVHSVVGAIGSTFLFGFCVKYMVIS